MVTLESLPTVPFTRSEAAGLGVDPRELSTAVRNGLLRRPLRGVYVRADLPDSVETRCQAAAKVVAPGSVVRDRTAAWLDGVDVLGLHEHEILPPLETCVLRHHSPTRRAAHAGGTRDLLARDVMGMHGLCVTTPIRTALDNGCVLSQRDSLAMFDQFMFRFGLARARLRFESLRYRRRRGVVQLRRMIELAEPGAESPGESWTRFDLIDAGLPAPVVQHWVEVDGVKTYRLDMAYPLHRVAIEHDGEEFHTSAADRADDEERRAWLRAHGWIVIVVRKESFTRAARDAWTDEVRRALASRSHR